MKAQGIDRKPTQHLGPTASAMEQRGIRTFRGDVNRRVHTNSAVVQLQRELAELQKLEGGIAGARKRFSDRKAELAAKQEHDKRRAAEKAAAEREAEQHRREQMRKQNRGMER